jgi:hypothetical protein
MDLKAVKQLNHVITTELVGLLSQHSRVLHASTESEFTPGPRLTLHRIHPTAQGEGVEAPEQGATEAACLIVCRTGKAETLYYTTYYNAVGYLVR